MSTISFGVQTNTLLIESTSAKLFTIIYPKQKAETVILLHGGPGVPMDFSPIAEQLSRKYQVIAFDQRGTGRSPVNGATYSIDEYLKDIDAVAQHFGVDKFNLFGHSWGGLYAQIYSERNPQKVLSMFLSSPSSGTGELWKQTESEVMAFNKERSGFWGWSMMGVNSLIGMFGSDTAYQSLFKRVLENYNREFDSTFSATDSMVENIRAEPINKTRPSVLDYPPLKDSLDYRFPIMITYGQKDIYGESKQGVKKRFPNATFVEFENAGHIAWKHNKNKFDNTLIEFYHLQ
jgi:pimeloyl-ACP methyl ester carboxylesterase